MSAFRGRAASVFSLEFEGNKKNAREERNKDQEKEKHKITSESFGLQVSDRSQAAIGDLHEPRRAAPPARRPRCGESDRPTRETARRL